MKKKEAEWEKQKSAKDIQSDDTIVDLCEKHLEYQIEQGELKLKSIDRRECTIDKHIAPYPVGRLQL